MTQLQGMKPTRNLVILRVEDRPTETPGGIYIPLSASGRSDRGRVLAVGEGWYTKKGILVPCCVSVGDFVLFDPYRLVLVEGTPFGAATPHGKPGDLVLLHDDAILGVIE